MKKQLAILFSFFLLISIQAQTPVNNKTIVSGLSTTKFTEFAPTISADGKTIIFESDVKDQEVWELFESQLDEKGNWSSPVPLISINEKCQFIAGPNLSYDGNTLYYTAFIDGVSKSEDIYYSQRTGDNSWSAPINLGPPINTDEYEGFPSISSDGTTLYFMRQNLENDFDKKSKEPCFKIYFSKKRPDGNWSEPEALPSIINGGCERDPRIMADNHTLIFSSIRSGGKGGFDMFQSSKKTDGSWSEPISLDFVNSAGNDQSPCISASGDLMYFYSENDIYSTSIPEQYRQMMNIVVEGRVLEDQKLAAAPARIHITNQKTNETFTIQNSNVDGEYGIVLNTGSNYQIIFDNENFLPDTLSIAAENQKTYQLLRKNIILKSSFPSILKVVDKDLNTSINAWTQVEQNGAKLYEDSTAVGKDHSLTVKTSDFSVQASKHKYSPIKESFEFKKIRTSKDRNVTVRLEHIKSSFTTHVVNVSTKQKANVKVLYKNQDVDELLIAPAGESTLLRTGDRYQVVTSSEEGYFFSTRNIVAGNEETIELHLVPIEVNGLLTLNNITFKTNSADLFQSSLFELDRVVELLQVNPKLVIEISAHTDDVGDENFNLKLSNKRAQSTLDYLMSKGIGKDRLVSVGYGETKPVASNDTEENRSINRRVELRVLKIGT